MRHGQRRSWQVGSGTALRPVARLFVLLAILGLGVWFAARFTRAPFPSGAETARPSQGPRRAPFADLDLLKGAVPNEPFLVDNDELLLPTGRDGRMRGDADARYHLLLLAATTPADWLLADAAPAPAPAVLRSEPSRFQGQLLRAEGELLAARPLPLKRDSVAGLKQAWQLLLSIEPTEPLLALCTEWPAGWPPPESISSGSGPRVAVAGYFLKNVRLRAPGADQPDRLVPVLVGRSARALASPPSPLGELPFVFAVMAMPVGVLLVAAWLWHRRGDVPHRRRLSAALARQQQREADAMLALEGGTPQAAHPARGGR